MDRQSAITSFDVLIIGAGLAGLATAIALKELGHHVTILEAAAQLSEIGAGIQVPPNAIRALKALGVFEQLSAKATRPHYLCLKRWQDGSELTRTPLYPEMEDRYGCPYFLIHRGDLHKILLDRAKSLEVEIRTGVYVSHVDTDATSVTLESGRIYTPDIIIGADGLKSRVRGAILEHTCTITFDSNCAYRTLIPGDTMLSDPLLRPLIQNPVANCWIGEGGHVMAYPIRGGSLYNFVMNKPGVLAPGKPFEVVPIEDMRIMFKDWDPILTRLINLVPECTMWSVPETENLDVWSSGRVVLVGDACHAMWPYMSQGAAMAFEDAAVLAECLSWAHNVEDIPQVIQQYEKTRHSRCHLIHDNAQHHGKTFALPDGPEQVERDGRMKAESPRPGSKSHNNVDGNPNRWDDDQFSQWLFGHCATDLVCLPCAISRF